MRYIDLEVTHIRSMDIDRNRHNYEGFYKKTNIYIYIYQMSIIRGDNGPI